MPTPQLALTILVLPALVTLVVVLITRRTRWGVVIALGAGYLAGHLSNVWPKFPPDEVFDRLPALALAATRLGLVEAFWPDARRLGGNIRLVLMALALAAILGPVVPEGWSERVGLAWLAAGIGVVVW